MAPTINILKAIAQDVAYLHCLLRATTGTCDLSVYGNVPGGGLLWWLSAR